MENMLVACYVIEIMVKNTSLIKDYFIPSIIMVFAIVYNVGKLRFLVDTVLQGIIISFVAVGFNLTLRQLEKSKQV